MPDNHDNQIATPRPAKTPWVQYGIIAFCLFGLSLLATLLVTNWNTVNALIYESSLVKYEVMNGERGPATYLVFHSDFDVLKSLADKHDGILGVEQDEGANYAKMAFISAKSPLIEQVGELAAVHNMINRNVPMLCH